jgi:4-amino-4-deoxy-L-arabinose transferase-like glycosyltransferase
MRQTALRLSHSGREEGQRVMTTSLMGVPSASAPGRAETSAAGGEPRKRLWPLLVILGLGVVLRLALWAWFQGLPPQIVDERHYSTLGANLVRYGEFAFKPGELTSERPPLYPALVAVVYRLCGIDNCQAVRLVQAVISLLNVVLLYHIGRSLFSRRVALWAAGLYCFYPSLLGYNNLLLTEVLFTFLYCSFAALLIRSVQKDSLRWLLAAGIVLGLAALARSMAVMFAPLLVVFLLVSFPGSLRRRLAAALVVVTAFAAVVAPWAIRNTLLHKTFVAIDHQGARNFMIGNYRNTPLYRSWTGAELSGDKGWFGEIMAAYPPEDRQTPGMIDKLATRESLKFIQAHPGLTLERDVIKFFNFWGLERELLAGGERGYFGSVSLPTFVAISAVICGAFVFALLAGVFGAVLAPPADRRAHWFLLLLIAYVCAMHTLSIGHSRYHLPVMPLVILFAASAVVHRGAIWQRRGSWSFRLACGLCAVFVGGWVWILIAVDGTRVLNLLRSFA